MVKGLLAYLVQARLIDEVDEEDGGRPDRFRAAGIHAVHDAYKNEVAFLTLIFSARKSSLSPLMQRKNFFKAERATTYPYKCPFSGP